MAEIMAADDDNVDSTLVAVTQCITRKRSASVINMCEIIAVHIFIVIAIAWPWSDMFPAFLESTLVQSLIKIVVCQDTLGR